MYQLKFYGTRTYKRNTADTSLTRMSFIELRDDPVNRTHALQPAETSWCSTNLPIMLPK